MNRLGICGATVLVFATLATSCTSGTSSQPAPAARTSTPAQPAAQTSAQPAAAPVQAAPPPAPGTVLASGQYSTDPDLRGDLLEVKRVSGGALMIKWRLVNAAAQPAGGLTATQPKPIHYFGDWGYSPPWAEIYFIDPAENKKYSYLTDSEGHAIADVFWGDLPLGQQRPSWAKFPAPPATSTKISVHIPSFPPFEDIPVSQ